MKKNLLTASAVIAAASLAIAAPVPPKTQAKPLPLKHQSAKPQPDKKPGKPQAKPDHDKKPGKPQIKPLPPKPQSPKPQVIIVDRPVEYHPMRNTYTIQLNADNAIIFEQRIVGMQELRDKIRMIKYDRPRPFIQIKVEDDVNAARLDFAFSELKKAGFDDVKIIKIRRRQKFIPHHRIPDKRMKR
jgi:biopolymer transport protein ExbD